jgi:hypothetical protein
MMHPLIISILPAIVFGTLNWIYWFRKGYRSFQTVFLSYCAFYGISAMFLSAVLK